jgi:putative lipoic acid-binding regulatory protein
MSNPNGNGRRVKLTFADDGEFHSLTITIPAAPFEEYERLVDLLREEPSVTRQLYVDMRRLVSAVVEDES